MLKGFIDFVREQGVIGLTVGFIIGGSVTKVVTALVTDLVTPFIGLILGSTRNLKEAYLLVGSSKFMWGDFISNLIDFIVIALIIYILVKIIGVDRIDKKKQENK